MAKKAAITVHKSRDEVQRLWRDPEYAPKYIQDAEGAVSFVDAPGDRGTEIRVDLEQGGSDGKLAAVVAKIAGSQPAEAKVKDDLRRFKQLVETGVIVSSEGTPQGESAESKFKQRPAQPLDDSELEKVNA